MKHYLLFLLFLALPSTYATDDDWEAPPDGFVWPDDSNLPDFGDDQLVPLSDLSPELRKFLDEFEIWKSNEKSPKIYIHWVDLNEDSSPEIVVETIYGGSGGAAYMIATRSKDGWRDIGDFQGGIHITAKSNGWYQLEGSARGGGGIYSRYLLRYMKDRYVTVRSEVHDSINKKVEILPSETEQDAAANP